MWERLAGRAGHGASKRRNNGHIMGRGSGIGGPLGPPTATAEPCLLLDARCGDESNALPHPDQAIVTGAFSYTGRYVAGRLLEEGVGLRTLNRNLQRENPFGGAIPAYPLDFSDPDGLRRSMEGAGVLYTYWIRFGRGRNTFEQAVENTRTLFEAAAGAGVGRIVHFSVVNASVDSRMPYFRGKGEVEEFLNNVGMPCAIIRPTLVFGQGDLLLNNMAWALRRFPVFPYSGRETTGFSRFTLRTW